MEEELEFVLNNTPTVDIAARMVKQSATIFKIADCSHGMKGVGELREAVALVRAATTVMVTRARENHRSEEVAKLRRDMGRLRAENQKLRRKMEEINSRLPPPTASRTLLDPWETLLHQEEEIHGVDELGRGGEE